MIGPVLAISPHPSPAATCIKRNAIRTSLLCIIEDLSLMTTYRWRWVWRSTGRALIGLIDSVALFAGYEPDGSGHTGVICNRHFRCYCHEAEVYTTSSKAHRLTKSSYSLPCPSTRPPTGALVIGHSVVSATTKCSEPTHSSSALNPLTMRRR